MSYRGVGTKFALGRGACLLKSFRHQDYITKSGSYCIWMGIKSYRT